MWLDLGMELLQTEDLIALKMIKNYLSDCREQCLEMFTLWLQRQPNASWRHLINALKRIHQNTLATSIETSLSRGQVSEEIDQTLRDVQLTFKEHMSQKSHISKYFRISNR